MVIRIGLCENHQDFESPFGMSGRASFDRQVRWLVDGDAAVALVDRGGREIKEIDDSI